MEPVKLKRGDPCPACGGKLEAARVATDAEFARARDRENPQTLAPGTDTATPEQRAELGALHVCGRCRYQTRFAEKKDAPKRDEQPATTHVED